MYNYLKELLIVCMDGYSVFRQEQKYIISRAAAAKLRERLSLALSPDSHSDGEYTVRSLYFDTPSDTDFFTKLAGTEKRRKIRLRTYGEKGSPIKLELKEKFGSLQKKTSIVISESEARELVSGNFRFLAKQGADSAAEQLYALLRSGVYRSKVLMEYSRTAFVHPLSGTRITLDARLAKSEGNLDFFGDVPLVPVWRGDAVLEVKFSGRPPDFLSGLLSPFCLTQSAVSKYCNSRKIFCDFSY